MADSSKWFKYFDKKFIFAMIEGQKILIEEGFDLKNAITMKYKSDEHFELLYERPDLIKYSNYYLKILISIDERKEEWYFIK